MKAMYNLALCYDNGFGLKQDYEKAVYWYTKAGEHGNSKALEKLKRFKENIFGKYVKK